MAPQVAGREQPDFEILIVGGGFSGLGMAMELRRNGIDDFVIAEKGTDVGGTWRDVRYPNVAVDIPSFTYQFSYAMNPTWSRVFAKAEEVHEYAQHLVEKFDLARHIRYGLHIESSAFDEANHLWRLQTNQGELTSRIVIGALGALTQPKEPNIPGLADFTGRKIHSHRWTSDISIDGERVGVIGTGATAVQVVPWIAERAAQQHVFQRTPIWVMPKPDFEIPDVAKMVFANIPGVQNSLRLAASAAIEVGFTIGTVYNRQVPLLNKAIAAFGRGWIRAQVGSDRELREKLTPSYDFGCKRPSMSNQYYRTFTRPNTELVTDGIERITATGILTKDGRHREVDTLVLATGYLTSEFENAPAIPIHGRDGQGLREFWRDKRFQAYEGTSVPGFPNLFTIFGPYAALGSSWMFMVEYQAHHVMRALKEMREREATLVEIRQEVNDEFFADIQKRMGNSIFFNANCSNSNSYYFDAHGDAPFLRPSTGAEAWWRSRHYDIDAYRYAALRPPTVTSTRPRRKAKVSS